MLDRAQVLEAILDDNGNLESIVVEQEDHTRKTLPIKPPGVGDKLVAAFGPTLVEASTDTFVDSAEILSELDGGRSFHLTDGGLLTVEFDEDSLVSVSGYMTWADGVGSPTNGAVCSMDLDIRIPDETIGDPYSGSTFVYQVVYAPAKIGINPSGFTSPTALFAPVFKSFAAGSKLLIIASSGDAGSSHNVTGRISIDRLA